MSWKLYKIIFGFIIVFILMNFTCMNVVKTEAAELYESVSNYDTNSNPTFKWTEDFKSCIAYFDNDINSSQNKILDCIITKKEDNHSITYTSTVQDGNNKYEDSIIVWNTPAGTDEDLDARIVVRKGYKGINESLMKVGFDSESKIKEAMLNAVGLESCDNNLSQGQVKVGSQLYDVEFQLSFDGGKQWTSATKENFPENGLVVTMPYPEGVDKDTNNFIVTHMFNQDLDGRNAGDIEKTAVIKTDDALEFKVNSLSPILIVWYDAVSSMSINRKRNEKSDNVSYIEKDKETDGKLIWSSSNENVAIVDENGKVTGVGDGECIITSTTEDGVKVSECNIKINNSKARNIGERDITKSEMIFNISVLIVILLVSIGTIAGLLIIGNKRDREFV